MGRLFKAEHNEQEFINLGYTTTSGIDELQIKNLYDIYNKLSIKDDIGLGYNVGMNSNFRSKRIEMQNLIIETIGGTISNLLDEYVPYSATFMEKTSKKHLLIKAHQDFSYTDENNFPSFMCWIPLLDVSIHNGALGYIPGSHSKLNYIRAFPSPLQPTPVTENQVELMRYFTILPMKKGDAVFFNHKTIHGSFPNVSNLSRLAVGINFVKKNTTPLAYIFNPESKGVLIDVFGVDSDFITHFSNTELHKQYQTGKITIPYEKVNTINWESLDLSNVSLMKKLELNDGDKNNSYSSIIKTYYKHERQQKLFSKLFNMLPFK